MEQLERRLAALEMGADYQHARMPPGPPVSIPMARAGPYYSPSTAYLNGHHEGRQPIPPHGLMPPFVPPTPPAQFTGQRETLSTRPSHPAPPSIWEWPREPPASPTGEDKAEPTPLVPHHTIRADVYGDVVSPELHQPARSEPFNVWTEWSKAPTSNAVKSEDGQCYAEGIKEDSVELVEGNSDGKEDTEPLEMWETGRRPPTLPRNDSGAYSDKSAQTVDRCTTVEDVPDEL